MVRRALARCAKQGDAQQESLFGVEPVKHSKEFSVAVV